MLENGLPDKLHSQLALRIAMSLDLLQRFMLVGVDSYSWEIFLFLRSVAEEKPHHFLIQPLATSKSVTHRNITLQKVVETQINQCQ